jgi:hypothetical protein
VRDIARLLEEQVMKEENMEYSSERLFELFSYEKNLRLCADSIDRCNLNSRIRHVNVRAKNSVTLNT